MMQGKRVYPEHEKGFVLQDGEYCNHKGIWWGCTPNGLLGNLSNHDVVEHPDGTISVSPSILVTDGKDATKWHGYLEFGVWREA
jgi:hypothetical protein